eukprot:scaffold11454_cov168-Amphora_coffeaeformis.AAC.11
MEQNQQEEWGVLAPSSDSPKDTWLCNVLVPIDQKDKIDTDGDDTTATTSSFGTYARKDIFLSNGNIAQIRDAQTGRDQQATPSTDDDTMEYIDCTDKMVLPGFVNAHTHSYEHWARGLVCPLPLELWVTAMIRHEARGEKGWYGAKSFEQTPAWAMSVSALHCGVEAVLSGCTAVMDHIFVRHIDDIQATVNAYKALGIRAFIAPMLGDDAVLFSNYVPLVHDAQQRNEQHCNANRSCCCGGLGENGKLRTEKAPHDPAKTKAVLELWEEAVQRFHDPANGIEIVIGPVTVYSASTQLLKGAAALRKKYNLCGHTHLLETRAQALMAKTFFPSQSAVKHLREAGFLDRSLRGTSFAHTVWLSEEEYQIVAEENATCVHNPISNLRLGSGIMPVYQAANNTHVKVAMGCDGAASSDGQDMLEALKLGTILSTVARPDYREWLTARKVALHHGAKNGYHAVGMQDQAGELKIGMQADLTLWDLTSLALLPRTDPLTLLILGSRTQAPGAGSTLHSSWVRGHRVVADGSPTRLNLVRFREFLCSVQKEYRDSSITNPSTDAPSTAAAEREYRAAMGLDKDGQTKPIPNDLGKFPQDRVPYDSTIE